AARGSGMDSAIGRGSGNGIGTRSGNGIGNGSGIGIGNGSGSGSGNGDGPPAQASGDGLRLRAQVSVTGSAAGLGQYIADTRGETAELGVSRLSSIIQSQCSQLSTREPAQDSKRGRELDLAEVHVV